MSVPHVYDLGRQGYTSVQAAVRRDKADKPLQPWQVTRLQAAAAAGRRNVKVGQHRCWLLLSRQNPEQP